MVGKATGETYQERTKGKDVRTSNIVAAKVSSKSLSHCIGVAVNALRIAGKINKMHS